MNQKDFVLVSMPWAPLEFTPIQLGILLPVVKRAGFRAESRSYFLAAMEYFAKETEGLPAQDRITVDDYKSLAIQYWRKGL